jgi:hypothetical protein
LWWATARARMPFARMDHLNLQGVRAILQLVADLGSLHRKALTFRRRFIIGGTIGARREQEREAPGLRGAIAAGDVFDAPFVDARPDPLTSSRP